MFDLTNERLMKTKELRNLKVKIHESEKEVTSLISVSHLSLFPGCGIVAETIPRGVGSRSTGTSTGAHRHQKSTSERNKGYYN